MVATQSNAARIIDASPTKDFFIEMLIKDLELTRAIIDLVDNCIDGAIRVRGVGNYDGLWVRIEATPDQFRIVDNCGGISIDLAREYAFRFGRPADMIPTPGSIGQFGIGMKRALFKLGSKFIVESTTETSRFKVDVDVNKWKTNDRWEFHFSELDQLSEPPEQCGTIITVDPLHDNVAKDFELEHFLSRLRYEIRQAHQQMIENQLAITLNGIPLDADPNMFLSSRKLHPAYYEETFTQETGSVKVRVYAGISESVPSKGGWNIYCNGRMVLSADQSLITGWGERDDIGIPKYHNQFARFRGLAFFDSDNAGLLPWNTTKTGVDSDSPIYRAVRLHMITLMRPVIDFLNRLKEETEVKSDEQPLSDTIETARSRPLARVLTSRTFTSPPPSPRPKVKPMGHISYHKPVEDIDKIKKVLKVKTHKEVGEKTFDYFYDLECK